MFPDSAKNVLPSRLLTQQINISAKNPAHGSIGMIGPMFNLRSEWRMNLVLNSRQFCNFTKGDRWQNAMTKSDI